jgi:hypothetical protein
MNIVSNTQNHFQIPVIAGMLNLIQYRNDEYILHN